MKKEFSSEMATRRTLPAHAYHPNVALMASGRKNCYVAYPAKYNRK